jgi:hypothetical protein
MACEWRTEWGKWRTPEREVVSSLIGNHISCLLYGKKLWRFSTLISDKFQVTTFSLSKRFALGRNDTYVELSNLN